MTAKKHFTQLNAIGLTCLLSITLRKVINIINIVETIKTLFYESTETLNGKPMKKVKWFEHWACLIILSHNSQDICIYV